MINAQSLNLQEQHLLLSESLRNIASQHPHSVISRQFLSQIHLYCREQKLKERSIQQLMFSLNTCPDSVTRVRYLHLIHIVLGDNMYVQDLQFIQCGLDQLYSKIAQKRQVSMLKESSKDLSFETTIEIPYITFLKKVVSWHFYDSSQGNLGQMQKQFVKFNRLNEILQMKKWFQHYQKQYFEHQYVSLIFETCMESLKYFWHQICLKAKEINENALKYNKIEENQYFLLLEAQNMQEKVHVFLKNRYFSDQIKKIINIKYYRLIKPEIRSLYSSQKRSQNKKQTKMIKKLDSSTPKTLFNLRKDTLCQQLLSEKLCS